MPMPRKITTFAIGLVCFAQASLVPAAKSGTQAVDDALKEQYGAVPEHVYATADLNADGTDDAIVLLTGSDWCGSGGCKMLILRGSKGRFLFVSSSTITQQPIRVLLEARMGWKSLSVSISGGGAKPGQVVMRFDGEGYPNNPTIEPYATAADLRDAAILKFKN